MTTTPSESVQPEEAGSPDQESPATIESAQAAPVTTETATAQAAGTEDASAEVATEPEAEAPQHEAAPTAEAPQEATPEAEAPQQQEAAPTAEVPQGATPEAATPAQAPGDQAATPPTPAPKPRPIPRPIPRPGPRPGPTAPSASTAPTPVVPAPTLDPAEEAAAAAFGSVAADGTVTVRDGENERVVGQVPDQPEAQALDLYIRRYLDLKAQVLLLETRLPGLSAKEATSSIASLAEHLQEPAAVGDLPALRERLTVLEGQAEELRAKAAAEREAAKAQALVERTAIVEKVEAIAGTPVEQMQWRDSSAAIVALLDEWKTAQRHGVRIDRGAEDALWKRFSHARTSFDKARRTHFAALDKRNAEAKGVKADLVARAEALASSTDWGPTARAFRDLMDEWRAAPRGSRKDDDALWTRFKGAQDTFFAARNQMNAELDTEYQGNLEVKEALLARAEALLPISDLRAAKRDLRSIQDEWDAAGKVPRSAMHQVEARLRAVEQAVRDAEQEDLRRSDPELKARADGMTAQLTSSIAALQADIEAAEAAGDAKAAERAKAELATKQQWLDAVQGARH